MSVEEDIFVRRALEAFWTVASYSTAEPISFRVELHPALQKVYCVLLAALHISVVSFLPWAIGVVELTRYGGSFVLSRSLL